MSWGAIDEPSTRKIHRAPIPRLGGLAIWIALWGAALLAAKVVPPDSLLTPSSALPAISAIFAGATVILIVGMADDRRGGMTPLTKLVGQFVACTLLVAFGIRLTVFGHQWIDLPLTYLWVMGLTNALNLLDNMDGLSAGASTIAAAFFFLLAVLNGQILVALLAVALVGSCLGFLIYNYNPASIFMGDTGSLSLGFLLAVIGMKLDVHRAEPLSFAIAAVVLSLPIFDTGLVVWRRLREGRRITQGGKDHTSHRLVQLGLGPKQAVWVLYGGSFVAGAAGVAMSIQGSAALVLGILVPFSLVLLTTGLLLARVKT
ncbi:MAG: MraY family glycosyltransferase [Chloroflexota bacterium]